MINKIISTSAILLLLIGNLFSQQKENLTLTKIRVGYTVYLDNGFEKIDLLQKGTISRSFFKLGTPQLLLVAKSGPYSRKNLIISYTLIINPKSNDINAKPMKNTFTIMGSRFTKDANNTIIAQNVGATITFTEVSLAITDLDGPNSAGVRNPKPGQLPLAFFLYLE